MSDINLGASAYLNAAQKVSGTSGTISSNDMVNSDLFMQLLVTQMQHQDPLSQESDPTAQISQLATFAMVEQLEQMNSMFEVNQQLMLMNQGADLIGKEVTINLDDENTITGNVDSVQVVAGTPLLNINGKSYPVNSVIEIKEGN
jgi:flagellar basal-body rod modification protein FlgD